MTPRLRRHAETLRVLSRATSQLIRIILRGADRDLINCVCECASNILKGNVPLTKHQKERLRRYQGQLRNLTKKSTSLSAKKKVVQTGGFLSALLAPLAGLIASLFLK